MKITVKQLQQGARLAIDAAGGQTALARLIGERQPTIAKWLARGIARNKVLCVFDATRVPLHKLRPDLYRAESGRA